MRPTLAWKARGQWKLSVTAKAKGKMGRPLGNRVIPIPTPSRFTKSFAPPKPQTTPPPWPCRPSGTEEVEKPSSLRPNHGDVCPSKTPDIIGLHLPTTPIQPQRPPSSTLQTAPQTKNLTPVLRHWVNWLQTLGVLVCGEYTDCVCVERKEHVPGINGDGAETAQDRLEQRCTLPRSTQWSGIGLSIYRQTEQGGSPCFLLPSFHLTFNS